MARSNVEVVRVYDELAELSRTWWPYGGLVYFHLLLDSLADQGTLTLPHEEDVA